MANLAVTALPAYVQLPILNVLPEVSRWTPDGSEIEQARRLAKDIKSYPAELNARQVDAGQVALSISCSAKHALPHEVEFIMLNGTPGCGKSYYLRTMVPIWLQQGDVRFHTWNTVLREQIITAFRPMFGARWREDSACTSTVPLFQQSGGTLILDDAGLLWPGMIPLILLCNPGLTRVVVTFDSAQGKATFPQEDAASLDSPRTVDWLSARSNCYATANRRLAFGVAYLLGLPRAIEIGTPIRDGNIYIVAKPPTGIPLLVTSPRFATSKRLGGAPALTLANTQGLSVAGDIAVDCGGLTTSATDANLFMALTRATGSVFLVLPAPPATSRSVLTQEGFACSLLLSTILAVAADQQTAVLQWNSDPNRLIARAVQQHLRHSLSAGALATLGLQPGRLDIAGYTDFHRRELPLNDRIFRADSLGINETPALQRADDIRAFRRVRAPVVDSMSRPEFKHRREFIANELRLVHPVNLETELRPATHEPVPLPSFPVDKPATDPALLGHRLLSRPAREVEVPGYGRTQQVEPNGSNLGLSHSRRDRATDVLSLKARITVGEANVTSQHVRRSKDLAKGFSKFASFGTGQLDRGLYRECEKEAIRSWVSGKSKGDIQRSVKNSPPDWGVRYAKLFLKSQRVKKSHKATSNATKGQVVTDFSHTRLFQDAAWALYIERSLLKHTKRGVYLHARANFATMSKWYDRNFTKHNDVTYVDYTGWDGNVDEAFTLFYANLLRSYGMHTSQVERFVSYRLDTRAFLGPIRPMQHSGDRWTWLLNTVGNMALTGHSFSRITPEDGVCFSGDDMIVSGKPKYDLPNPGSWGFQPKLSTSAVGDFCGFQYGGDHLYISPSELAHRGIMSLEDGVNQENYWQSYAHSLRFAVPDSTQTPAYSRAVDVLRLAHSLYPHLAASVPRYD